MPTSNFFNKPNKLSRVKSAIVGKYFNTWATVMMSAQSTRPGNQNKIAYVDLFSGPGKYDDGTPSTPIRILQHTIANVKMRNRLVTFFNDQNKQFSDSLRIEIEQLPNVETLKYPPTIQSIEVGHEVAEWLESNKLIPSLVFLDPWGYKGLSLDLINAATKDWGCDCILFFNYNRINMGLNNPAVIEHMDSLFGKVGAAELRQQVKDLRPADRELTIIEKICEILIDKDRYVLPFRFKDAHGTRTSHHLFLVTKHFKGYDIMKEIMAKESSNTEQGIASFEYNPVENRRMKQLPLLADFVSRPLNDLADMLLTQYAGKTISMREIYEDHSVGRPYIAKNYKQALWSLEESGKITASKHRKSTFGDSVQATFPKL